MLRRRDVGLGAVIAVALSLSLVPTVGASSPSPATDAGSPAPSAASQPQPSELRDYPYCEVIADTVSGDTLTEHVFNTLPYGPCIPKQFAEVTEQDISDAYNAAYGGDSTSATINGPRHWVLDSITSTGGVTSSGDELTVDGIKFGLTGELEIPVGQPTIGTDPYVVNTVQRNTIFVFEAGRQVFELTDPDGNVYVMQSYSQQVEPSLSLRTLPDIGTDLQLPEGWTYAARTLDEDLTLTAAGSTQIVNDVYKNTYQIDPAGG